MALRLMTLMAFLALSPSAYAALAQGNFGILPRFTVFTLKSTDKGSGSPATISSKLNPGAEFNWTLKTEKVRLYLFTDFQYVELAEPANKVLNPLKHSLVGGGLGVGIYPFEDKKLLVSLFHTYQQNLYFRAETTTNLTVDKIAVPDIQLRLSYDLFRGEKFTVFGEAGANMYFTINTDTQRFRNGYGAFFRVLGGYDFSNTLRAQLGPSLLYASHNTVLIDQTRTEYTLLGGLTWFLE